MGMLGGMMMASDAATEVSPAVNAAGYPFATMAGMMMLPIAATSATAEPEISAKNMDEATLTMPSPPRICPTSVEAMLMMRREMPAGVVPPPASRATSTAAMRAKPIGTRSADSATMSPITTPLIAAPG